MKILLILIPAPIVGYLILDSVRRIFSDDTELVLRIFKDQPVSALAVVTAVGSAAVWAVVAALGNVFP